MKPPKGYAPLTAIVAEARAAAALWEMGALPPECIREDGSVAVSLCYDGHRRGRPSGESLKYRAEALRAVQEALPERRVRASSAWQGGLPSATPVLAISLGLQPVCSVTQAHIDAALDGAHGNSRFYDGALRAVAQAAERGGPLLFQRILSGIRAAK